MGTEMRDSNKMNICDKECVSIEAMMSKKPSIVKGRMCICSKSYQAGREYSKNGGSTYVVVRVVSAE